MTKPILPRNKISVSNTTNAQYTQPTMSLLNYGEYKQTLFTFNNDSGAHLVPATLIRRVIEKSNGSVIICKKKIFHSELSIDYWQTKLCYFDKFRRDQEGYKTKVIPLFQT